MYSKFNYMMIFNKIQNSIIEISFLSTCCTSVHNSFSKGAFRNEVARARFLREPLKVKCFYLPYWFVSCNPLWFYPTLFTFSPTPPTALPPPSTRKNRLECARFFHYRRAGAELIIYKRTPAASKCWVITV